MIRYGNVVGNHKDSIFFHSTVICGWTSFLIQYRCIYILMDTQCKFVARKKKADVIVCEENPSSMMFLIVCISIQHLLVCECGLNLIALPLEQSIMQYMYEEYDVDLYSQVTLQQSMRFYYYDSSNTRNYFGKTKNSHHSVEPIVKYSGESQSAELLSK